MIAMTIVNNAKDTDADHVTNPLFIREEEAREGQMLASGESAAQPAPEPKSPDSSQCPLPLHCA